MSITVYIPTPFRRLTGNRALVEGCGKDVAELLENLESQFPGLRTLLFDDKNQIPAHINVYVNNREIGTLKGTATPLKDGDEVAVIPAVAGGAGDARGNRDAGRDRHAHGDRHAGAHSHVHCERDPDLGPHAHDDPRAGRDVEPRSLARAHGYVGL